MDSHSTSSNSNEQKQQKATLYLKVYIKKDMLFVPEISEHLSHCSKSESSGQEWYISIYNMLET